MLQKFEQNADSDLDPEARAEFKQIFLRRIANLEALEALKASAASPEPPRLPFLSAAADPPADLPTEVVASSNPDTPAATPSKDTNAN